MKRLYDHDDETQQMQHLCCEGWVVIGGLREGGL